MSGDAGGPYVVCEVASIRLDPAVGSPALRLRDTVGGRELDIYIGAPEAAAIHTALEGIDLPRPLTHDLFATVLGEMGVRLDRVVITHVVDGTYHARLELASDRGTHEISSRPSDAVALALRLDAPVLVSEAVIAEAAVSPVGEETQEILDEFKDFIDNINPEDFGS
jgi:hypothetical protein